MKKLNPRKFKNILKLYVVFDDKINKSFGDFVFSKLDDKYVLDIEKYREQSIDKLTVCYAGDIAKNFIEFYRVKNLDFEKKIVNCFHREYGYKSFRIQSVVVVPEELFSNSTSNTITEMLDNNEILTAYKQKRKNKREQVRYIQSKIDEIKNEQNDNII